MTKMRATCNVLAILMICAAFVPTCDHDKYKLVEGSTNDYQVYASSDSIRVTLSSDAAVSYFRNDVEMLDLNPKLMHEAFGDEAMKLVYIMPKTIEPSLLTNEL